MRVEALALPPAPVPLVVRPPAGRPARRPRETTHRLTAEEFFCLPLPEEEKWELVKGELHLAAAPAFSHQRIFRELMFLLEPWLRKHPEVELIADWDVKFLLDETRRPDLVIALKQGSHMKIGVHGEGAPDFIIEILSPGQQHRDLGDKKELYERCGVREYWVVDYQRRQIHQFLPDARGRYVEKVIARGAVRSRVLAGFALRLKELFRVLNGLPV